MSTQIWEIKVKITGNFLLINQENIKSSVPPHPDVCGFFISPEFDNKNKQTGTFNVIIAFKIDAAEEKPPAYQIADLGRDILSIFINLLAFLSVNPVHIIKPISMVYNYPNTKKYRLIEFPSQQANLSRPIPLDNNSIFNIKLEKKHNIILTWFRKALEEKDITNSIIALFIPLEILANQFPCEQRLILECEKCGHIIESKPGMRIQVQNFLTNIIGYSVEIFEEIWNTRNDILHGKIILTSEKIRDLYKLRQDLIISIIKGMKQILGIASTELPVEKLPGPFFTDPFTEVEYIAP